MRISVFFVWTSHCEITVSSSSRLSDQSCQISMYIISNRFLSSIPEKSRETDSKCNNFDFFSSSGEVRNKTAHFESRRPHGSFSAMMWFQNCRQQVCTNNNQYSRFKLWKNIKISMTLLYSRIRIPIRDFHFWGMIFRSIHPKST